ncbi:signal peptide-containing protein [Theileria equi strain WA]|uniref:Signal peptide-containing protein n=1 Tax=Theileria equi strain WA TaxID=1537102 RepID=L0AWE0_THEEQ|nr:signal peptide-containing protein [Theileria equi strain WA]AFZ79887.1 signal peptide-containing protein [Theileria equi strain WA]|eukprot:XP_004829553.1 signal peptide-containing protein [Theileria equi strain WA]
MRILVFICLIFLHQLCEGAGNGKKAEDSKGAAAKVSGSTTPAEATETAPVEPDTIDVSKKPNDNDAIFVEYDDEGITYKSYTLRDNVTAKTVKEGNITIWTVGDGGKHLKVFTYSKDNVHLCRINVKSSNEITPHFFEKVNGKWESLEHPEFSQKLNDLLESVDKKMRLEFMMLSDDVADFYEYYAHGMLITVAFPKFKTTSVSCTKDVWTANGNEECICARFYTRRGGFCTLYIKNGDKTEIKDFEYSGNQWKSVCNRNAITGICTSYRPSEDAETKVTTSSMDITKEDNTVYNTKTFIVSGIDVKRHTPLPNKWINEVKDGGVSVWKNPNGQSERCISCEFKSKGNVSLTSMLVCTSFDLWFLYFEKNGNEWKSIEKKADFDKKIEEMKKMETTQPTSIADLLSKVDSTLFNVEEAEEDNFKVLKLKAKDGVTITELTYGEETLWQAPNAGDSCSVATFYLGPNNDPVAASYRFKRENDGKTVEGYRQFSGGKWLCLQDIDREG